MTFFNGTTTMDAYVDLMADQLVASGFWSEPDVAFYPALATPAKRVLTDGTLFVFIQRIVTNGNANSSGGATINGTGNARFNEIKVSFGSGYNLGTHALSGTTQDCGVPLEAWQRGNSGNSFFIGDNVGSGNKTLTHFSWSDPATGSFLGYLIANGGANTYDYVVFFCLERNTTKQYADGFSNIYWTCYPAHDFEMTWSSSSTQSSRYFGKLPFNSYSTFGQYPDGTGTLIGNIGDGGNLNRPIYYHPFNGLPTFDEPFFMGMGSGVVPTYSYPLWTRSTKNAIAGQGRYPGFESFFAAYRSQGDSKAYFQFPWYNANSDPIRRSLIAQTQDLWFDVGDSLYGLVDGDIIDYTAPGPTLKRYLVKSVASPEATGGGRLNVAIRFA